MSSEARREELETKIRAACDATDAHLAATRAIEGYGPELLAFLHATMNDATAAAETFSQLCEDLWRGIEGFQWQSSFRTWAYTLAKNARSRYHRDGFRKRSRALDTGAAEKLANTVRARTQPFLRTTVKKSFTKLRKQLSPDDQALLLFRIDRGMSWADVALAMEARETPASPAALKMRFGRLKQRLEQLAEEEGLLRDESA